MNIAVFTNESFCTTVMSVLNTAANLPQLVSKEITPIHKHTTQDKWWFICDHCCDPRFATTAGAPLNYNRLCDEAEKTLYQFETLEKTDKELYDEGWLPTPEEP